MLIIVISSPDRPIIFTAEIGEVTITSKLKFRFIAVMIRIMAN